MRSVPERVAVVATELATNALRYGRPPTRVYLRRTEHSKHVWAEFRIPPA